MANGERNRRDDDDSPWWRQLALGLGALVVVALLVGGVVSMIALGAARITGLEDQRSGPAAEPSLYIPSGEPTTSPEAFPNPPEASQEPSPSESESPSATPSKTKKPRAITLQGFPAEVSAGERINLTGVYGQGEGATLQVQRFQGGWTDFPVTARVSGGLYNTWVVTGRTGKQKFRMLDKASGKASNPVTVTVR